MRTRYRTVVVVAMLVVAIGTPLVLWLIYGRNLELDLIIELDRYQIAPGESITARATLWPAEAAVVHWQGPGTIDQLVHETKQTNSHIEVHWTPPTKPGVYTLQATAKRSGTMVQDTLSVRVIEYGASPGPNIPDCEPLPEKPRLTVDDACFGGQVMLEIPHNPYRHVWYRWAGQGTARGVAGRKRSLSAPLCGAHCNPTQPVDVRLTVLNLRTHARPQPQGAPGRPSSVHTHAGKHPPLSKDLQHVADHQTPGQNPAHKDLCLARYTYPVMLRRCNRLFADFRSQRLGPGMFRLTARPPRGIRSRAEFIWQLDGEQRVTDRPRLVHTFKNKKRFHEIMLNIRTPAGTMSARHVVFDASQPDR